MITPKQPTRITFDGWKYRRAIKFRVIDDAVGISIGPLYRSHPDTPGVLFMPDLAFLKGISKVPSSMHRIIQPEKSAKAATRSSRRRRD